MASIHVDRRTQVQVSVDPNHPGQTRLAVIRMWEDDITQLETIAGVRLTPAQVREVIKALRDAILVAVQ